jgi:hypothetical protein
MHGEFLVSHLSFNDCQLITVDLPIHISSTIGSYSPTGVV